MARPSRRPPRRSRSARRCRTVYGGVAASISARARSRPRSRSMASSPSRPTSLHQLLTDSSSDFIDATARPAGPRRPSQRRLRASSTATSTRASGRSIRRSPTRATSAPRRPRPTARRATCDFGDNPLTPATDVVRLQQQAHRRRGRSWPPTCRARPAPPPSRTTRPATPTATARTRPRPRPATSSTSAKVFGVERGPINGIAPGAWVSVYKVCGIAGLLRLRLRGRRRAGHPRRRRRHQLLDLGRHRPVHRPGRARVPRRLRRRRVRVDLGRQRRPGRRRPPTTSRRG